MHPASGGLCRGGILSAWARMKHFAPKVLLLGGLLAASSLLAVDVFEGKVSLGFKSGREKEMVVDYAMKDGLVRMEPKLADAGGSAMIFDWAKKEMTMLMPEQRMYMVMPLNQGQPRPGGEVQEHAPAGKIEKTGKTETILGYLCEQLVYTENNAVTEMWVTEKLGAFMGISGGGPGDGGMGGMMGGMMGGGRKAKKSADAGWEEALKGMKAFFPLRVISKDAKGKESFRLEAKSIEPGSLPSSLFAPPAGFQKFSMPGFGGMMGG